MNLISVFAYVDPGSGLLAWQMVAAACVGGIFYLKKFRAVLSKLGKKVFRR